MSVTIHLLDGTVLRGKDYCKRGSVLYLSVDSRDFDYSCDRLEIPKKNVSYIARKIPYQEEEYWYICDGEVVTGGGLIFDNYVIDDLRKECRKLARTLHNAKVMLSYEIWDEDKLPFHALLTVEFSLPVHECNVVASIEHYIHLEEDPHIPQPLIDRLREMCP